MLEASPGPPSLSPELFDRAYADLTDDDGALAALLQSAMGDEYPAELAPNSLVTWSVLDEALDIVDLSAGSVLMDLACGAGGPGLWLARESGADLIGIDWSPEAVRQASERSSALERAVFEAATTVDPGGNKALAMLREEAREVLPELDKFDRVMVAGRKPQ